MLSRFATATTTATRCFSTSPVSATKVAVCGAAGGIGQPLSTLLKLTGRIDHLSLYDIQLSKGVAADVSHINAHGKVTGHVGEAELDEALSGCDVVVIPAGVPRKPGMTRDDLFSVNASIVKGLAEAAARNCPEAALCIISNPVNSTVPIVAETLKAAGVYNPAKLFGVTTLDVCRANTFIAENQGWDVATTNVPVVGGHAGITIVPLLSQIEGASFSDEDRDALTHRIQFGGDEVVQAKEGTGSATLSMAYAGAHFTEQLLRAFAGEKGITECTFVDSSVTDLPFFSSRVELGTGGVEKIHPVGAVTDYEQAILDKMAPELAASIEKGIKFVKDN